MKRKLLLLAGMSILLSACANTSVQKIGTSSYAPTSPSTDIVVFTSESQIHQAYEVVGIISHNDPGKYQVLSLADAIPPLKEKARAIGGNAIIIDKSEPVKSGIISTGIYVEARAIRLAGGPN